MKLEKTLWVLTLFLAFVMVIPSVALAQIDYNLTGTWTWMAKEAGYNFTSGKFSAESERFEFCIEHDLITNEVVFFGPDGWVGYTEWFVIGAHFLDACSSSVLTGRANRYANIISGTLTYFEFYGVGSPGCPNDDDGTGSYSFRMRKVSHTCP